MDVAVVTGAGRGIGRAIARELDHRGYAVLAGDLDLDAAAETAALLGEPARAVRYDVRDPQRAREVAREACREGRLAVWVNNAGVWHPATAWEHDDDDIRRQVEVNVLGMLWGCRAALEGMGGRGDIVNLASLSALGPVPGLAVYSATKAAVLSFTTSLGADLRAAGSGVRVHVLCPDVVATDMVREVADVREANVLFTSSRLLLADEVARAACGLVGSRRVVRVLPLRRGLLLRAADLAPSLTLELLPLLRGMGERRRHRIRTEHGW